MPNDVMWDAAIHVFDDAYPCRPGLKARPPHAPISRYLDAGGALDADRLVLSQPSAYGFDNSLLIATLAALQGRGRGIVVLPPATSYSDLTELHARGVRGVRFLMSAAGVLGWDEVAPWATRAADLNWVLKFQLTSEQFIGAAGLLVTLPCKVILDVYPGALALDAVAIARLGPLLETGRTWLSFAAPLEDNKDFNCAARELINSYPKQCLWASNWPSARAESRSPIESGVNWLSELVGYPLATAVRRSASQLFDQ